MPHLSTAASAALLAGLALAAPAMTHADPVPAPRPNILLILADDLGIGDLSSYDSGSLIPTPALDRLASEGVRFTDAYCPAAVCTPTRFALMTGTYPHRSAKPVGVQGNWERPLIPDGTPTLPGLFQAAGYRTVGIGKWHLGATFPTLDGQPPAGQGKYRGEGNGANIDLARPLADGPRARGFDRWRGFICASEMILFDDDRAYARLRHDVYAPLPTPGFDQLPAIGLDDYLAQVTDDTLAELSAHAALPPADKRPLFLYYGPYVPHVPLAVPPEFKGRTRAGDYGDYVAALDHHVGRLLDALDRLGLAENTLVIFASDNGSQFATTGDGHRPNGAYRGAKHQVWDGGVRTPLLLRWPVALPAGVTRHALVGLNDLFATVADLLRLLLPPGAAPDSVSFAPALAADAAPDLSPRARLLLKGLYPPAGREVNALRSGPWKFIPAAGDQPAALFNLADDIAEITDVAAQHPDVLARLAAAHAAESAVPDAAPRTR